MKYVCDFYKVLDIEKRVIVVVLALKADLYGQEKMSRQAKNITFFKLYYIGLSNHTFLPHSLGFQLFFISKSRDVQEYDYKRKMTRG